MLKEFKEFISKGSVLDLAVGVVMGAAFTAIVNSLVDNLISPLIGALLAGISLKEVSFQVAGVTFGIGAFLDAIVSFLIISFILFLIVKAANKMRKPEVVAVTTKECPHCKTQIHIDATRCPNCTSEL